MSLEEIQAIIDKIRFKEEDDFDVEKLIEATEYLIWKKDTLFDAIKHGDENHQEWLRAAVWAHFNGFEVQREKKNSLKEV